MRISVIVPTLNESARLGAALVTLARREDIDEVIVVDAGRDADDFRRSAPLLPKVRCIGSPRAGRAVQMNIGADAAEGDLLLFLHLDTELPGVDLRRVLGVVGDDGWGRFDVSLDADRWWARMIGGAMNLRSRWSGIATGDQGIFVARALWRRCGGYRELPLMEDIELCRRLRRHARPLCLAERVTTSARRWQRHGVTRTILLMWRMRMAYALGTDPARLARSYHHAR